MSEYKIGFIGAGNMGSAMMEGILCAGLCEKNEMIASCHSHGTKERVEKKLGIRVTLDNREASSAKIVFLAVKPYQLADVVEDIKGSLKEDTLVISVVAGKTLLQLGQMLGSGMHIVRSMPNTPAMVGAAMSAICTNDHVTEEEKEEAKVLFESFGQAEVVREDLMDVVTGVSGSSPAFIYMVIEAMADAAVAEGMQRKAAYKFAAQTVLGSAKMVLETGKHPGELKDAVTSPGGTTIEGVAALEANGLRATMMAGVRAAVQKSRDMSK